jgi:molybdate transport system substrate-binding protein
MIVNSKYGVGIAIALLLIAFLLTGCYKPAMEVNVSAATSLTDALGEINALYKKENPNVNVIANFAAPGTIQQQIENGAPADVFISASPTQMDALQKKHLIIENTRKDLLRNKVVLVVPGDSTLGIKSFNDLTGDTVKKVAIGDPDSVAAGMYAREIFNEFGIMDALKPKLVLAGNVRQVLQYVESSSVDAGVVFMTDAKISPAVQIVANAPDDINSKVVYPVAIIDTGKDRAAAADYEDYLFGNQAGTVFEKYGFSVIKR